MITFEELAALAIDTDNLPPMRTRKGDGTAQRKGDRKRSTNAKRETRARREVRAAKYAETVSA